MTRSEYQDCEGYMCTWKKQMTNEKANQVKGKTKCWQCSYYVAQMQVMRTIIEKGETDTYENMVIHSWLKETKTIEQIKGMLKEYGTTKDGEITKKENAAQVKDLQRWT